MPSLPIDEALDEIASAVRNVRCAVVEAPPGAGKTTRVPAMLLDGELAGDGEVVVLQPRRIATRLAARRVAEQRGERLGESVGYRIRFESVGGPNTRLRFVTEGVLSRTLTSDPSLSRIGIVVLDEFHERHVHGDLALALCRRLQLGARPDLGIVVMSATLDTGPVAKFLGDCPIVRTTGRRFDVAIHHLPRADQRPLSSQVVVALRALLEDGLEGDVLVFLPGAAEIRRTRAACSELCSQADLELLTLHGNLPAAAQDRALSPCPRRKLILSTNVAESSVTIDGVVAVIDGGLARVASHASWSGLGTLRTQPISRASAAQRAGRAGRTRPGRCLRLYTRADHDRRAEHDPPEISRLDLAETVLALRAHGPSELVALKWLEPPPAPALESAEQLLAALGALTKEGALTELGSRLLRFPAHPRIARVLVEAERRGVVDEGCLAAALLTERDIALSKRAVTTGDHRRGSSTGGMEDPYAELQTSAAAFRDAAEADFAPPALRALGIDPGAARAVDRVRRQYRRLCSAGAAASSTAAARSDRHGLAEATRMCLLAGYPDRVAKRIRDTELGLAGGGAARLAAPLPAEATPFVIALDAEERHGARGRQVLVRTVCSIEPDWLLDMFPDAVTATTEQLWSAERERVETVERLMYQRLVLEEARSQSLPGEQTTALLARAALARGPSTFSAGDRLERWLTRLGLVRDAQPSLELPSFVADEPGRVLEELCVDRSSFAELEQADVLAILRAKLSAGQRRAVAELAPAEVVLPGGRRLEIHYQPGKPPWIASRLQDFFGMADGPRVAGGKVAVVLHLLAPNGRPVQVTGDLASFWQNTYPTLRGQLRGRYPKHDWPADGATATPPPPGRLRARRGGCPKRRK